MEHRTDPWLLLAVVGILSASLATLQAVAQVVGPRLFTRQLVWGVAGVVLLWLLSRVHVTVYERLAPVFYAGAVLALVAVLIVGEARGGTRGWFAIGPITVQPSEFARLATAFMVAAWLGKGRQRRLPPRDAFIVTGFVLLPTVLVLVEPDLGVALTYLPLLAAALWLGGLPARAWVAIVLLGVLAGLGAWNMVLKPYQKERVLTVLDPERDPYGAGYQVRQSKIAVGSGSLIGQGLGRGSQSALRFLPAQHTDFIFAAWAEATGFVGSTLLLLAYAVLLVRTAAAALAADTRHGLLLVGLIGAWLGFQIVVNLGMVVGWLPTTGITLPLFSYGGSSLLTTCAALGVVQSVWRYRLVNQ